MKKIILLSSVLGLVGCATPKHNYVAVPKKVNKPPVGATTKAFVGDKLLTQGLYVDREALFVPATLKFSGYTLLNGYFLKTGEDNKGQYFQVVNMIPNGGSVQKSAFADPFTSVMLDINNKLCVVSSFNVKACTDNHDVKITTTSVASDNTFEQTLIYSGKVGNKINVGYREFSSNTARPAFNNNVEYDLSQSKEIGYKGALLEIIDASNKDITYKVIRNFSED